MRRSTGFTLIEMLLASSLLLILLGLIFNIFVPLFRAYAFSDARATLRQNVAVAMDRVVNEIDGSNSRGLSYFASPSPGIQAVLIAQPVDAPGVAGNSTYLPELHFVRYEMPAGRLSTAVSNDPAWANGYGAVPVQVTPAIVIATLAHLDNGNTLFPGNVTRFTVTGLGSAGRQFPLSVTLAVSRSPTEQFNLTRMVTPINRGSL